MQNPANPGAECELLLRFAVAIPNTSTSKALSTFWNGTTLCDPRRLISIRHFSTGIVPQRVDSSHRRCPSRGGLSTLSSAVIADMPDGEAISTTKRKFYKALDALSNPPAARVAEPAAKRARRSISSTSTLSRRPIVVPATGKNTVTPASETPPNFSPWSHETFVARLKTFSSVSLWYPKPEAVGEVAWAKRGWTCVDVNTVGCRGGCGRRVVVILDSSSTKERWSVSEQEHHGHKADEQNNDDEDEHVSLENALVRRYSSMIIEGHSESCLWRQAGCKDDIYRLQVVRPAIWQPALQERTSSLLKILPSIQNVKIRGLPCNRTTQLPPEQLLPYFPPPSTPPPHCPTDSIQALQIALHGWHGATQTTNDLLLCNTCFQRIGLWMYQPGYKSSHPFTIITTTTAEEVETQDAPPMTIDLLEQHREHCPWRNAASQKAAGSLAGLNAAQIQHRVVTTWAREQRRKFDEQHPIAATNTADEDDDVEASKNRPALSRMEIAVLDQERESRLRKLKNLFTIKRRGAGPAPTVVGKAR